MTCLHGVGPREHCPACAVAWRKETKSPAWEAVAKCPHGLATLLDGSNPERVLKPGCEGCGTAMAAKKAVRR